LNYFDLFDLPVSFSIDKNKLRKKYYALNRENHPDNFTLVDQEEQMSALDKSSIINEAFKTLKDDMLRIKYTLELTGIKFEEGNESVPQIFLMEMMDINENIFDFKMNPSDEAKTSIVSQINLLENRILENVTEFINNFDFNNLNNKQLELIKDYYLKRKYLNRIENNFDN